MVGERGLLEAGGDRGWEGAGGDVTLESGSARPLHLCRRRRCAWLAAAARCSFIIRAFSRGLHTFHAIGARPDHGRAAWHRPAEPTERESLPPTQKPHGFGGRPQQPALRCHQATVDTQAESSSRPPRQQRQAIAARRRRRPRRPRHLNQQPAAAQEPGAHPARLPLPLAPVRGPGGGPAAQGAPRRRA